MENAVFIWLAASIALLLVQQAFLWGFLRRRQVEMRHFLIGAARVITRQGDPLIYWGWEAGFVLLSMACFAVGSKRSPD